MRKQLTTLLLNKIKQQDSEKAFNKLYYMYYDRFFRIAFFYLHKDEWAQEVTMDIFLSIWNNRKSLTIPNNFENYFFILIKNASLNYLEKEQKRESTTLENIIEKAASFASPEDTLEYEELFQIYLNSLQELPERCRQVFILVKEEKMSYAQTADQLKISTKTVDAQLQKALSRIKEKINRYFSDKE